jgi:hypothetical protein
MALRCASKGEHHGGQNVGRSAPVSPRYRPWHPLDDDGAAYSGARSGRDVDTSAGREYPSDQGGCDQLVRRVTHQKQPTAAASASAAKMAVSSHWKVQYRLAGW